MANGRPIVILTADAGFEHRSAANAVAAALQETYGDGCVVEIVNPLDDVRVPTWLRRSQADYDRIVRETPDLCLVPTEQARDLAQEHSLSPHKDPNRGYPREPQDSRTAW